MPFTDNTATDFSRTHIGAQPAGLFSSTSREQTLAGAVNQNLREIDYTYSNLGTDFRLLNNKFELERYDEPMKSPLGVYLDQSGISFGHSIFRVALPRAADDKGMLLIYGATSLATRTGFDGTPNRAIFRISDSHGAKAAVDRFKLNLGGHTFYIPHKYFQDSIAAAFGLMTVTFPDYLPVPAGQPPCISVKTPSTADRNCFRIDFHLNGKDRSAASTVEGFDRVKQSLRRDDPAFDPAGLQVYREGPDSAMIRFYTWQSDGKPGAASCISVGSLNLHLRQGICLDEIEPIPGIVFTIKIFETNIDHIQQVESGVLKLVESFESK